MSAATGPRLKRTVSKHAGLLVIVLASLVEITWSRGLNLILGAQLYLPFHPLSQAWQSLFIWAPANPPGLASARDLPTLLYSLIFVGANSISSLAIVQNAFLYVLFVGSGVGMKYLFDVYFPQTKSHASTFAGLVYLFNPFNMIVVRGNGSPVFETFYCILPFALAFYVSVLRSPNWMRYLILFLVSITLGMTIYLEPVMLLTLWGLALIVTIAEIFPLGGETSVSRVLKRSVLAFVGWLAASAWYLVPVAFVLGQELQLAGSGSSMNVLNTTSSQASLLNIIRLFGFWPFYSMYNGNPYYVYQGAYSGILLTALSFLTPVLLGIGLLKRSRLTATFGLVLAIFLFLSAGSHAPLGSLFVSIFSDTGLIAIVRDAYYTFMIPASLAASILVAVGVANFWELKRKAIGKPVAIVLMVFLTVALVWPMWTGDVYYPAGNSYPAMRTQIPPSFVEADSWLASHANGSTLFSLPEGSTTFVWNNVSQSIDLQDFFSDPLITGSLISEVYVPQYVNTIYNLIDEGNLQQVPQLLAFLNVRYVVVFTDIDYAYEQPAHYAEYYQNLLNNDSDFSLAQVFEGLVIYRVAQSYWLPEVYAATQVITTNGMGEMLDQIAPNSTGTPTTSSSVSFDASRAIFASSPSTESLNFSNPEGYSSTAPTTSFFEVNPTEYVATVKSSSSFYLVLGQSYDQNWVASTNASRAGTPVHFVANGFANGWFINSAGKLRVTIQYRLQTAVYLGAAVTVGFWILITYASRRTRDVRDTNL